MPEALLPDAAEAPAANPFRGALANVCEQLLKIDPRKSALCALSLVNRFCADVSRSARFRRVTLESASFSELRAKVDALQNLRDGKVLELIRVLNVVGPEYHFDPDNDDPRSRTDGWDRQDWLDRLNQESWTRMNHRYTNPPKGPLPIVSWYPVPGPGLYQTGLSEPEWAWLPLATLVQNIPNLSDFIFNCTDRVPPHVVGMLSAVHPKCRLHVHFLDLSMLCFYSKERDEIPRGTTALLASPCLYSMVSSIYTEDPMASRQETTLQKLVSLAPSLRHVWMRDTRRDHIGQFSTPRQLRERDDQVEGWYPPPSWLGFEGIVNYRTIGRLNSLVLSGTYLTHWSLWDWTMCTDFTLLTALEVYSTVCPLAMEGLAIMAQDGKLCSLKVLALNLETTSDFYLLNDNAIYLHYMLDGLGPLDSLILVGPFHVHLLQTLVNHHADSLRYLSLNGPSLHPAQYLPTVVWVKDHFRHLRDLKIPVTREGGSGDEVLSYRVLGRLPHLQRLTIELQILPKALEKLYEEEPDISEDTQEVLDALEESFESAAIDEELAMAIYDVIIGVQSYWCLGTGRSPPLQCFRVEPRNPEKGCMDKVPYHLIRLHFVAISTMAWLARHWVCESHVGVEGGAWREVMDEEVQVGRETVKTLVERGNACGIAWRDLWGWMDNRFDWMENWASKSLDLGPELF